MSITSLIVAVRTAGAAALARLGAGFTAAAARARAAGRSISTSMGPRLTQAFTAAGRAAAAFGATAARAGAEVLGTFAQVGVKVAAIGGLIAAALPAIIELSGLLALIPAGLMAIVASALVVKFAFKGIGEAISAGLSGKWNEWEKAHKDFPRSAHDFAAGVVLVANSWKKLRREIQSNFFHGLGAEIMRLNSAHLPTMARWLPRISTLFNQALLKLSEFLRAPEQVGLVEGIFRNLHGVVQGLLGTMKPLAQIFLDIAAAGAPRLASMSQNFADSLQRIADKIREFRENGKLGAWIDKARDAFATLRLIIGDLASTLGAFYGAATADGKPFLDSIREQTLALKEWAHSTDGQTTIQAIEAVGTAIIGLAKLFGEMGRIVGQAMLGMHQIALDVLASILRAAARAFAWHPIYGPMLDRAASDLEDFRDRAQAMIDGIHGRDVEIKFKVTAQISAAAAQFAGQLGDLAKAPSTTSRIQFRAQGGPVRAGQPYVVGDGGRPELFVPDRNGRIEPHVPRAARTMASGGGGHMAPASAPTSGRPMGLEALFWKWFNDKLALGEIKFKLVNGRLQPV